MTRTATIKRERFNLRLTAEAKKQIERAASLEGTTAASFVLSSALTQAKQTIREHEAMVLSPRDADLFFDALVNPPKMNAKLAAALKEHDRRVTSR